MPDSCHRLRLPHSARLAKPWRGLDRSGWPLQFKKREQGKLIVLGSVEVASRATRLPVGRRGVYLTFVDRVSGTTG